MRTSFFILASANGAFWGWITSLLLNSPLTDQGSAVVAAVGAATGVITFGTLCLGRIAATGNKYLE